MYHAEHPTLTLPKRLIFTHKSRREEMGRKLWNGLQCEDSGSDDDFVSIFPSIWLILSGQKDVGKD